MGEFPEDICRLVNEFVPWDRHHRSPTAQLVRTEEFQNYQLLATQAWQHEYILMGSVIMGRSTLFDDETMTWERIQQMMGVDAERETLTETERFMLAWLVVDMDIDLD